MSPRPEVIQDKEFVPCPVLADLEQDHITRRQAGKKAFILFLSVALAVGVGMPAKEHCLAGADLRPAPTRVFSLTLRVVRLAIRHTLSTRLSSVFHQAH